MIVWAVLFIILLFFAFITFIAYKMASPPRLIGDWTPKDLGYGYEYEELWIRTKDGLRLHAWWIDQGNEKTIIPLHGYTASKWEEIYMKPTLEILLKGGYNVLVFDFRAHGKSEGKYTTIGDKELIDVLSAVDWIRENKSAKAQKIGLIGFSMGAIVTIRALAEDERICCGIADSPPIYMDRTGARGLKYFAKLPIWLYSIVKPITLWISRGKIINIIEYANKIKKPLLLIAGKKDPLVMIKEVEEFYKKNKKINPEVNLWVSEAAHVRTINISRDCYETHVLEFFGKML
ncbi:alpha/beta hydrolase [Thermococcus sp.]